MSYGTSMVVGGQTGLGESASIDWASLINTGITSGLNLYTAEQQRKATEQQQAFDLKIAKLNAARSAEDAGNSSGDTTQSGLWKSDNMPYIVGGVAIVAVLGFVLLGKRRR